MSLEAILAPARESGLLRDVDVELSLGLCRIAGEARPLVARVIALLSHDLGQGHVCLPLTSLVERAAQPAADPFFAPLSTLSVEELEDALLRSPLCGPPHRVEPLCLLAGRLYLRRYFDHERALAEALLDRAGRTQTVEPSIADVVSRLFPAQDSGAPQLSLLAGATEDMQRVAAEVALERGLTVVSGGPGTGKTSTVVRILALLIARATCAQEPPPRIALLAPTGKAAARLAESVAATRDSLDIDMTVRALIPHEATTLHRALEARPGAAGFGRNRERPLSADVVLVDEASMVDLAMMRRLFDAIRPEAQVILLGDRDQLASVEAGAVLGDICGSGLTLSQYPEAPMRPCVVQLTRSYRYREDSGIALLSRAIRAGNAKETLSLLHARKHRDIELRPALSPEELSAGVAALRAGFSAFHAAKGESACHAAMSRFRILCAHRNGPWGVASLNRMIERGLSQARGAEKAFYPKRPIMVLRNDHGLRLYNGDVGIALPQSGGELRVSFEDGQGGYRAVTPSRLPRNESVYAMTIHKSQGSEFDQVAIVLPSDITPLLSRELLYTAVTRARKSVTLYAQPEAIAAAVETPIDRRSGLRERLWGA